MIQNPELCYTSRSWPLPEVQQTQDIFLSSDFTNLNSHYTTKWPHKEAYQSRFSQCICERIHNIRKHDKSIGSGAAYFTNQKQQ